MEEKKHISSVKLDDNLYYIKDIEARELLHILFNEEIIIDGGQAPIDATNE